MKYRNRKGEQFEETTSQDKLLQKAYKAIFAELFSDF
jgi:hypothetical protein